MLNEPQKNDPDKTPPLSKGISVKYPRILLAEDDLEMRKLLAWRLRSNGFFVIECNDGYELLDHLGSPVLSVRPEGFDLIISDIRMPGVTGLEVLEAIHQSEWYLPTILITAFGDDRTHRLAEEMGAAALFDKPFEIDDLIARVREVLVLDSPRGSNWTNPNAQRQPSSFPLDVVFSHLPYSSETEALINSTSVALQPFSQQIAYCRVVIEGPHFPRLAKRYHIQIMVTLDEQVIIIRSNIRRIIDEDSLRQAVRDAFSAMRGRLKRYFENYKPNSQS